MLFRITRRRGWLPAILLGLALAASFGVAQAAMTLNAAGATFPYPIYDKWFHLYHQKTGVQINYQAIGSGGGIQAVKSHTVDFGASDAPLSDAELKSMGFPIVQMPTVAGAVTIAYNLPGVGKGLHLTPDVIADIWLGKLTRWNDRRLTSLNPGRRLPNLPIVVAHRSDGSGTTFIFTHYLSAVSAEWKRRVGAGKAVNWPVGMGGKGNPGVAALVQQSPGGIGYIELAYAIENKEPYAFVRNRAGRYIEPTIATTTAAAAAGVKAMQKDVRVSVVNGANPKAYPIVGFTYLLLYQHAPNAAKGRAVTRFLQWAIHDGEKYATGLLYAPLPPGVVKIDEAKIKSLR